MAIVEIKILNRPYLFDVNDADRATFDLAAEVVSRLADQHYQTVPSTQIPSEKKERALVAAALQITFESIQGTFAFSPLGVEDVTRIEELTEKCEGLLTHNQEPKKANSNPASSAQTDHEIVESNIADAKIA